MDPGWTPDPTPHNTCWPLNSHHTCPPSTSDITCRPTHPDPNTCKPCLTVLWTHFFPLQICQRAGLDRVLYNVRTSSLLQLFYFNACFSWWKVFLNIVKTRQKHVSQEVRNYRVFKRKSGTGKVFSDWVCHTYSYLVNDKEKIMSISKLWMLCK